MPNLKNRFLSSFLILFLAAAPAVRGEMAPAAASTYERLRQLKETDPAAFERLVNERKQQIKAKFSQVRQADPARFENLKEKIEQRRIERLQRMRNENPGRFRQVMGERMQKMEQWKQSNPERYQQFIQNHPRFETRMQRLRGEAEGAGQRVPSGPGSRQEFRNTASGERRQEFQSRQEMGQMPPRRFQDQKQPQPFRAPQTGFENRPRPAFTQQGQGGDRQQEIRRGPFGGGSMRQRREGGPGGKRRDRR